MRFFWLHHSYLAFAIGKLIYVTSIPVFLGIIFLLYMQLFN